MDAPVKFAVLKLRNLSGRPRRLSVTGYWEWVLGELRQKSLLHVQTEVDPKTGALLARNPFNAEFAERIAFVDVSDSSANLHRGSKGVSRPQRHPRPTRRPSSGRGFPAKQERGWTLAPRCRCLLIWPPGRNGKPASASGWGGASPKSKRLIRRFRPAEASRGALEGVWAILESDAGRRAGRNARSLR